MSHTIFHSLESSYKKHNNENEVQLLIKDELKKHYNNFIVNQQTQLDKIPTKLKSHKLYSPYYLLNIFDAHIHTAVLTPDTLDENAKCYCLADLYSILSCHHLMTLIILTAAAAIMNQDNVRINNILNYLVQEIRKESVLRRYHVAACYKELQKGADLIIPVLIDGKLHLDNVTFILIQVKNHSKTTSYKIETTLKLTPEYIEIEDFKDFKLPYLSLYMQISIDQHNHEVLSSRNRNQISVALFGLTRKLYSCLDLKMEDKTFELEKSLICR
ncbi:14714_t:CDS:2 [Funneliformis mosseae]|uniref:14714_t:CDS:1 n=1 Tax=Funneliformis mosseae TaxID=27381 RepID=A0A9N9G3E6_FUNMO|nr:14714_t:CDS:2 [Funneliformis mosseae]